MTGPGIISRHYDAIKRQALDRLKPTSWGKCDWNLLRNAVGVALCQSRDEMAARLNTDSPREVLRFTKGNFRKAEAEIMRQIWAQQSRDRT